MSKRKAALLVNTRALKGAEWLEQTKLKLAEQDIDLGTSAGFCNIQDLLHHVELEGPKNQLIIIGGGDGTISAVAGILAKGPSTLGVLPLGTGNAIARDLDIPTDLDKAIEVLVKGKEVKIDLGACGEKVFLNVITVGLTASVAETLTVPLKRRFGRFVYAIALLRALRHMRPFFARIETENGMKELNAVQLVIGNGRFHGGPLLLSPNASITSGWLRLYAVESGSKAELLKYAFLLPSGLQGLLRTVHAEDTVGGTVKTTPVRRFVMDGEIAGKTPITFSIAPKALKVMAPATFEG